MADSTPGVAKSVAAVAAGALATIVVYVIDQVTGKTLPPEIVAAAQTLITTLAVFFTPHQLGGNT